MNYGLSEKQLARIPEKTKEEIFTAVKRGMTCMNVMGNGTVIFFGESHMPYIKRWNRLSDIERKAFEITIETGADFGLVKERFLSEMKALGFILLSSLDRR